jgi:hypothetical protein
MATNYLKLNEIGVINGVEVQCLPVDGGWWLSAPAESSVCEYYDCAFQAKVVCTAPCVPDERKDKGQVYYKKS